jgi:hypothetical protein
MSEHEEPEGYDGEVTVAVDGEAPRSARAVLGARFDPLAGSVAWSGRIALTVPPLTRLELTTPHGVGVAEATESDPWGNTRVSGIDRPPFPVELLDRAAEV